MNQDLATPRGRKHDQVRRGATAIFMRDGFEGASVDDIARAARVSKATLYSYFADKRLMFDDVLAGAVQRAFDQRPFDMPRDGATAAALTAILTQVGGWLLSEPRLSLFRITLAEARRFPDGARAWNDALNRRVEAPLAELIDHWAAHGQMTAPDPALTARQIMAILIGGLQYRAMLSGAAPAPDAIAAHAQQTAALFLPSPEGPAR